jgi:hypothetical protein
MLPQKDICMLQPLPDSDFSTEALEAKLRLQGLRDPREQQAYFVCFVLFWVVDCL